MIRQSAVRFSTLALLVVAGPSGIAQTQATRTAGRSIWDGVYTDAQAQRGEQLYIQHCRRCHGADLSGMAITPPWPSGLDRTPALQANLFNQSYSDLPLSDLVERIRISMPQERPGSLHRKATVDVIAYLLLQSGYPLGRAELSDQLEDLRKIVIVPYRR